MQHIQREWVARMPGGMLVQTYLIASYLYYLQDKSLLTDDAYDLTCTRLDKEWDQIEHHHKFVITRSDLSATTGFGMRAAHYPNITAVAANLFYSIAEKDEIYDHLAPLLLRTPHARTSMSIRLKARPADNVSNGLKRRTRVQVLPEPASLRTDGKGGEETYGRVQIRSATIRRRPTTAGDSPASVPRSYMARKPKTK